MMGGTLSRQKKPISDQEAARCDPARDWTNRIGCGPADDVFASPGLFGWSQDMRSWCLFVMTVVVVQLTGPARAQDVSFGQRIFHEKGAVMFFTTGELPMSNAQQVAFLDFVRRGGGFLGVHSATDTFYRWPEYQKLIGGYFDEHPWHQPVVVEVADRTDPLVAFLGTSLAVTDEIYQFRDFDVDGSRVLLRLDPDSVDLGRPNVHRHPYAWPLAWTRSYGGGRLFYEALGHEEAVWRARWFQQMLSNAALWVLRRFP
jgi:type 1 glutamine amidotransferase